MKKFLYLAIFLALSRIIFSSELKFYGFAGVDVSSLEEVKKLGANTAMIVPYMSAKKLKEVLGKAEKLNLYIFGRAEGKSKFQKGKKIDFKKLKSNIEKIFLNTEIAENSCFAGYYIIDEPCHPGKWNITQNDFIKFYSTVKRVNKNINVLVNFGTLECFEKFISKEFKGVDIALFTITQKKLKRNPNYIKNQNTIAEKLKKVNSHLKILPMVAIYEFPERKIRIPSVLWIKKVADEIIECKNFDGIVLFSWYPSPYMSKSIKDIYKIPEYNKVFRDIFQKFKD